METRIKSLQKALDIIEYLAQNPKGATLTGMVDALGINRTTCHRFLTNLTRLGLIEKKPKGKTYRIGLKLVSIGLSAYREISYRQVALPLLKQIRDKTGETTNLTLMDGGEIVIADRYRSLHLMDTALDIGSRMPAHCTSTGKAILAFTNVDDLNAILSKMTFEKRTRKTITNKNNFLKELKRIRQVGYSVCDEEFEVGMSSVGAPILNHQNEAVAGINISFALARHRGPAVIAEFSQIIIDASLEISRAIGFESGYPA